MPDWNIQKGVAITDATPTGVAGGYLNTNFEALRNEAPFNSAAAPTATDDSTAGFFAGSHWFDTATQTMWVCTDATASAAVWRSLYRRTSGALVLCPGDSVGQQAIQVDDGGNARGTNAVDLQATRTASTQVAAGNYSTIGGGKENTIEADRNFGTIAGGEDNVINTGGTHAAISGGRANVVSAEYGVIGGGEANSVTAKYGVVSGGKLNVASAIYSKIGGGRINTVSAAYGIVGGGEANEVSGSYGIVSAGKLNKATGGFTVIAGGQKNEANGSMSSIIGGYENIAGGTRSVVGGGRSNYNLGPHAAVVGGHSNSCYGQFGFIGGGYVNTISTGGQSFSAIGGGRYNVVLNDLTFIGSGGYNTVSGAYSGVLSSSHAVASKHAQQAQAGGRFAADGDAQTSQYVLRRQTTDGTANVELFLNGSSAQLTIPTDTTWVFDVLITGRRTDADNESAAYQFVGCIDNNGGTTAIVGSVTKTVIAEDIAAWDAQVAATNIGDALKITVTGEASKTINWVAFVRTVETTG